MKYFSCELSLRRRPGRPARGGKSTVECEKTLQRCAKKRFGAVGCNAVNYNYA